MKSNKVPPIQWCKYERRSVAIASDRQAAGGAIGERFCSTHCLLRTTEFTRISEERKKLKNRQNDSNPVYLYSFRYWLQFRLTVKYAKPERWGTIIGCYPRIVRR